MQLQLSQQATVARSAFDASFELDNQKPSDTLTDVSVNLQVYDMSGNNVTSLFYISAPTLQGLTAIDGTRLARAQHQRHGRLDDHSH